MTPEFNYFSDDPFKQLKDRIRLRLKEEMIDDKILDVMKEAYVELLRGENIILSRAENNRLFRAVLQETLNDILANLSGSR